MKSSFLHSKLFAFFLFIASVESLTAWNVTSSDFVRMAWASIIVIGDWLYIDGGEYYQPEGLLWENSIKANGTLSIDISKSWTTSNVKINIFSRPPKNVNNAALWWNEATSRLLSFGGHPFETLTATWEMTPDNKGSGTWKQVFFSDPEWSNINQVGYGLVAASKSAGYYIGGLQTTFPRGPWWNIPGLVTFDFASQKWSNASSASKYSASGMGLHGAAQFVPTFGAKGVIIMMGGSVPAHSWEPGNLRSMSNITIFDPTSDSWYSQTATGDVPISRRNMCIVGAQSSNSNTYEIFIYGGWNGVLDGRSNTDSESVYMLLLPSFRWVRVTGSAPPRAGSSCVVAGNRHMISVGGWDPKYPQSATPDPWPFGIGIFDMTTLKWSSSYEGNAATYERSTVVKDYYTKNALFPSSWDNPALAQVFSSKAGISNTPSSSSFTASPSATETTQGLLPPAKSSIPTYGIALAAIGGVIFIAVTVSSIWWFCVREKARNEEKSKGYGGDEVLVPGRSEIGSGMQWEISSNEINRNQFPPLVEADRTRRRRDGGDEGLVPGRSEVGPGLQWEISGNETNRNTFPPLLEADGTGRRGDSIYEVA